MEVQSLLRKHFPSSPPQTHEVTLQNGTKRQVPGPPHAWNERFLQQLNFQKEAFKAILCLWNVWSPGHPDEETSKKLVGGMSKIAMEVLFLGFFL